MRLGESDHAPLVIPDYARMLWYVRAPTSKELLSFVERVKNCLESVTAFLLFQKH
jgi:metal-dependent amidase/aminoacylase/carboxypeptidase family protein